MQNLTILNLLSTDRMDAIGEQINRMLTVNWFNEVFQNYFHGDNKYIGMGIAVVLLIICIAIIIVNSYNTFTPENTSMHLKSYLTEFEPIYGAAGNTRKNLNQYISSLAANDKTFTSQQKCLGNFYVMTANAGGIFLPGPNHTNAVCSVDAVSFCLRAGVRGFVFDVLEKLSDKGKPVIYLADPYPTKRWRQISMNVVPLRDPINRLRAEAFGEGSLGQTQIVQLKNTSDPIFIYLRFTKKHTVDFYDAVADSLDNAFKDYRLDYTWGSCSRETDFYATDVKEFMGRVIIMSNQFGGYLEGSRLESFINITAPTGIEKYYTGGQIKGLSTDVAEVKAKIQQHITVALDPAGTSDSLKNSIDWKRAHDLGIHMVAMNWWNKNVDGYRQEFGEYSFKLKPVNLRYNVRVADKPKVPGSDANPKNGEIILPEMNLRM